MDLFYSCPCVYCKDLWYYPETKCNRLCELYGKWLNDRDTKMTEKLI